VILVFGLFIYMGDVMQREVTYFHDINRCKYFADRIMSQPSPNKEGRIIAVCKLKNVKKDQTIYN